MLNHNYWTTHESTITRYKVRIRLMSRDLDFVKNITGKLVTAPSWICWKTKVQKPYKQTNGLLFILCMISINKRCCYDICVCIVGVICNLFSFSYFFFECIDLLILLIVCYTCTLHLVFKGYLARLVLLFPG